MVSVQDGGISSICILSLISSTTTSCVCQVYDGSDSENSATNYTAVNTGIGDDESHAQVEVVLKAGVSEYACICSSLWGHQAAELQYSQKIGDVCTVGSVA